MNLDIETEADMLTRTLIADELFSSFEILGRFIRNTRVAAGYTIDQVAEFSDIDTDTAKDIEEGLPGYSIDDLMNVAVALKLRLQVRAYGGETIRAESAVSPSHAKILSLSTKWRPENTGSKQDAFRFYGSSLRTAATSVGT